MSLDRPRLEELLSGSSRSGASSLHLHAGLQPWMRLKDAVVPLSDEEIPTAALLDSLARELLFADQREQVAAGHSVDLLYTSQEGERFRTTVTRGVAGLGIVFTAVPERSPAGDGLGLPGVLTELVGLRRRGLLLMTGFVGSGRRSTLATLVEEIVRHRSAHVVHIERQVSNVYRPQNALVHHREVGVHVASIAAGVRDAAVQGVDVLAVGELETLADVRSVLDATERGMLVLATCEARSVPSALQQLAELAPPMEQALLRERLADALIGAVGQCLLRRRHGDGRVPVFEVLVRNLEAAEQIRSAKFQRLHEIMAEGQGLGMCTIDGSLRDLLLRHQITVEEACLHAENPDRIVGVVRSGG